MKKITLLLFFCLAYLSSAFAQNYSELISEAWNFYENKNYKASKEKYAEAFRLDKTNYSDLYNAACSAALAGDKKMGLKMIKASVKNGWTNVGHMTTDSDLNLLHKTGKWKKTIAAAQKNLDLKEANYNKPLQAELLAINKDDQGIRREYMAVAKEQGWDSPAVDSLSKIMHTKDEVNLEKIVKILDKHGWVGPELVGNQANSTLFLVIQHSDLEVQKKYLPMMREAVKNKKARASSLALLEDRIALREGNKQIYGSQIGRNKETNESYVLPLKDPDNVDARRAEVGLGPLQGYVGRWDITWDAEAYKKQLPKYLEIQKKQMEERNKEKK